MNRYFSLRTSIRLGIAVATGVSALAAPGLARAGGFEVGDNGARAVGRGGAYAVGVKDPSAIYYNPGALAKQRGTRVLVSHNSLFHRMSYQRATLGDFWPEGQAGTTFDRVENEESVFLLGGMLVITSDFGLDNWTFALGAYGPPANGTSRYRFTPDEDYGPQSFMLTDLDVIQIYYSAAAAWKWKDLFGVGLTLQYVDLSNLTYGLVVDSVQFSGTASLNPIPQVEGTTQLATTLKLADRSGFTGILGLWGRPHERVEIGAAARGPIFLDLQGDVETDKSELQADVTASMKMQQPWQARGGVRYIHPKQGEELFDVEVDLFWEGWSSIEAYDIKFDGTINGIEVQDLVLPKNWRNTYALRLGSDYNVLDDAWGDPLDVTVRAGGFFETAAVPNATTHLDFPSFLRGAISAGFTLGGRGVYGSVGYAHIFQEDRTVTELESQTYQQRPLRPCPESCDGQNGVPANAGTYESSYDVLSVSLELNIPEIIWGRDYLERRARRKAERKAAKSASAPAFTPT
jgi:long-chain fatty acid transport protein